MSSWFCSPCKCKALKKEGSEPRKHSNLPSYLYIKKLAWVNPVCLLWLIHSPPRLKAMATMQKYVPLRERVYIGDVGQSISDHDESLLPFRPWTGWTQESISNKSSRWRRYEHQGSCWVLWGAKEHTWWSYKWPCSPGSLKWPKHLPEFWKGRRASKLSLLHSPCWACTNSERSVSHC